MTDLTVSLSVCLLSLGLPRDQGCHSSSTSKFPDFSDFSLFFFLQFSMPSDKSKHHFLFFSLIVLTVSLQIWGLLLKEIICSLREHIISFKSSPQ